MSKRVLIVDDDEHTVKFLSVALREGGYEPIKAYDGDQGYQRVEDSDPDLILLDVMMPKRSGFVLFKQLRKDERFAKIPVIMLTAVADALEEDISNSDGDTFERPYDSLRESLRRTVQQMKEEGVVRPEMFIEKPIEPEALIEAIREMIGS